MSFDKWQDEMIDTLRKGIKEKPKPVEQQQVKSQTPRTRKRPMVWDWAEGVPKEKARKFDVIEIQCIECHEYGEPVPWQTYRAVIHEEYTHHYIVKLFYIVSYLNWNVPQVGDILYLPEYEKTVKVLTYATRNDRRELEQGERKISVSDE